MTALGHERFLVAGGDIGSHVARYLALDHPDRVIAVHRMDAGLPTALDPADPLLTDDERAWMAQGAAWGAAEGAYAAMHRTKPQTAAVGLMDSPAGLAAWIVEKLRSWSDCGGDLESVYSRDEVLDLITRYWMTRTIAASMRMYAANGALPLEQQRRRVEVPSGFSLHAADLSLPPQSWLERSANTHWVRRHERGGHFAPFERAEQFADDLRDFFRGYRDAA